ncbi:hypothetical protein ACYJ1Y_13330 [Natrialbaceae archaeon A-gly3]
MNAETVDDLFERERRSERPALVDATGKEFDYHWLLTTTWKSGNFLRHTGVRRGVTVGVVGEGPLALLAFCGTALLEGTTRFSPPTDLADESEFRTLVAPVEKLETYDLPQGAQRVGYGDKPEEPDVHHYDAGLWSENPSFPPLETDPGTSLVTDGERTLSHARALEAAREVVDGYGLEDGTRVAIEAPLSDPRTVVVGVLAPLLAGGVIVLPGGAAETDDVDVGIGTDAGDERLDLEAVSLE